MSNNLVINTHSASQNYSNHFPTLSPYKSNWWSSVALRPEGVSKSIRSSPHRKIVSSRHAIRSSSFLEDAGHSPRHGTNMAKHHNLLSYLRMQLEGGFEPDLNGFFPEVSKIIISLAPGGVEFESNCSETPLNHPFLRRFPATRDS